MESLNFDQISTASRNIKGQCEAIKTYNTQLDETLQLLEHSWNDSTTEQNAKKYRDKVAATTENLKKMVGQFTDLTTKLDKFIEDQSKVGKDSGGAA